LLAGRVTSRSVLILGGTRFVGRHIAAAMLGAGHQVTIFNRGRTAPGLFASAEELRGDRDGDLGSLVGRRWDTVIDTSGLRADQVQRSAELLASAAHYVFISSVAVYRAGGATEYTEDEPLRPPPAAGERSYGEHKIGCELEVAGRFGGRATILRPAVLVGPHDPSGRFIRWPLRAREGGEMLVPGGPREIVPLADARDLAAWVVQVVEAKIFGVYNVAGPRRTMGDLVGCCVERSGVRVDLEWVDADWLLPRYSDFGDVPPLRSAGYQRCSSARATARGLRFRGLELTVDDSLAWWDAAPPRRLRDLGRAHERELLAEWRGRAR